MSAAGASPNGGGGPGGYSPPETFEKNGLSEAAFRGF